MKIFFKNKKVNNVLFPLSVIKTKNVLLDRTFIDLQWFSAEDEGRTEEATEYKINEARKKGRVAKSGDLNSSIVVFLPTLMLFFLSGFIFKSCM